jgi:hypothetical protein
MIKNVALQSGFRQLRLEGNLRISKIKCCGMTARVALDAVTRGAHTGVAKRRDRASGR